MKGPAVFVSRSSHADGIRLTVGLLAAALALIECVGIIVLANRPAVISALGIPEAAVIWVTTGAIVAMVLVIGATLLGVAPRVAPA